MTKAAGFDISILCKINKITWFKYRKEHTYTHRTRIDGKKKLSSLISLCGKRQFKFSNLWICGSNALWIVMLSNYYSDFWQFGIQLWMKEMEIFKGVRIITGNKLALIHYWMELYHINKKGSPYEEKGHHLKSKGGCIKGGESQIEEMWESLWQVKEPSLLATLK